MFNANKNSDLTVASFFVFKWQKGVFRAFWLEDEVKHSNDPWNSIAVLFSQ